MKSRALAASFGSRKSTENRDKECQLSRRSSNFACTELKEAIL
jgi:hypothetical protein